MFERTEQVLNLGRRMLLDQVDAVRRSTAEQLIMAARIDLDRCQHRLLHHVPGACSRQSGLPVLPSSAPLSLPVAAAVAEKGRADVPTRGGQVAGPESTSLGLSLEKDNDSASTTFAAADSEEASGNEGPQAGGAVGGVDGESTGLASTVAANSPVDWGGSNGEDTDGGHGVAEDRIEEPLGGLVAVADAADGGASPPSPSSPGRQIGGAAGEEEGRVEPLDRAGSCGLWLRLVIMPLVVECLEGSYRTKLLALHMAQVGGARRMLYNCSSRKKIASSLVYIRIFLCLHAHVCRQASCCFILRLCLVCR